MWAKLRSSSARPPAGISAYLLRIVEETAHNGSDQVAAVEDEAILHVVISGSYPGEDETYPVVPAPTDSLEQVEEVRLEGTYEG